MTENESPAARRHRIALAVRAASSVDAAAGLLRELNPQTHPADALDAVDVPRELAELEALPDWTYATLLSYAIRRRPAPFFQFEDEPHPRTMRASDLLSGRKYELVGILAHACEQAWKLGDAQTVKAMSALCETAVLQVVGLPALRVALGGAEYEGDAE